MTTTKVLAIDPATLSGFALLQVDLHAKRATYLGGGVVRVRCKDSDYYGDWCLDLQQQLRPLMQGVCRVFVEDFFFSKRQCNGASVNAYLRAAVFMLCRELGIPYDVFTPTHWKKYVSGGKIKASASDVRECDNDRKLAQKTFIHTALSSRFGLTFPDHTMVDGKKLKFKYDVSDAAGIGIYGISLTWPQVTFDAQQQPGGLMTR